MLKNYINTAVRNLLKHKFYTGINIMGLSIGVTCFLMIILYVKDELSYDNYHTNIERMYRLDFTGQLNGDEFITAVASTPAAEAVKNDYPEVEDAIRFRQRGDYLVKRKDQVETFKEEEHTFVDHNFFDFFSIPMEQGDPATALQGPNKVVLSHSTAQKYFGNENPIGQVLTFDNRDDYEVTGVYQDIPRNTHFHFDMMMSMETLEESRQPIWMSFNFQTYLRLAAGADPAELEAKFPAMIEKYIGPEVQQFMGMSLDQLFEAGNRMGYYLFPVRDIHLHSDKLGEMEPTSDIGYIYLFSGIAFFILLIACINFMNLATARSANRAKEVGIRKVMGAYRTLLVRQFLTEAIFLSFVSFLLAYGFCFLFLGSFNELAAKSLVYQDLIAPDFLLLMIAIMLTVGLLAGSYPAFYLSSFRPVQVLRGKLTSGAKSSLVRSVLVVFQFTLSIIMIVGTAVIFDQLSFIQNKKLGFDRDHVVMIQDAWIIGDQLDAFRTEVLRNNQVLEGTITSYLPVGTSSNTNLFYKGRSIENESYLSTQWYVDEHYASALSLDLVAGRFFSRDFPSDSAAVVINEAAVKQFGFEDPIGKYISRPGGDSPEEIVIEPYKVIGVVRDFHYASLRENIFPLVFNLGRSQGFISFKIKGDDVAGTLDYLEAKWDEFAPGQPFAYDFMDQRFNNLYESETQIADIFTTFSVLAVFIACLGLFGLASFTAEQRTKEIGIRKVLGASVTGIMTLLSKEFIKLVGISFLFAVPVSYYFMNEWLGNFAYRTQMQWTTFALTGVLAVAVAWVTMSFQTWRAARVDPAKSLKDE